MTGNWSSAFSSQQANAAITQNYAGSCDVQCNNTINGINISIIDSILSGGINLTQSCAVNAQCLYETSQNSLSDVMFKAANAGTAAGGILPGISVSRTGSYQDINESILDSVTQTCSLGSYNSISNVNVNAQSSTIGGGINFTQQGSTQGECTFNTIMNATNMATGTADNCSASGKMAKKTCGGKGGGIGSVLIYVGVGLVLFVGAMMLYRAFKGTPPTAPPTVPTKTGAKPAPTSPQVSGSQAKTSPTISQSSPPPSTSV